jgi:hypothetical protein
VAFILLIGGEEFGHCQQHLLDLILRCLDDLFKEIKIDKPISELEVVEHQSDFFDILLFAEEELVHLLQDEVFQLAILQGEIILDVDVEDPLRRLAARRQWARLHVQLLK